MTKKCTQPVPDMPTRPENRRKPGGYLAKANVDNCLDEIGSLETMVDYFLEFDGIAAKNSDYGALRNIAVKGNKSLRALKNELNELKYILNNK